MKKLDEMIDEAREKRSWGEITIVLKDGKPVLLRKTTQEKVEETPADEIKYHS